MFATINQGKCRHSCQLCGCTHRSTYHYGLPLVASEPRIKAAVLGMWGLSFVNSERLADDAVRIACPVLFQQKWDDELFTREGQIALFESIGVKQKWLYVYPGTHVRVQGQRLVDLESFLVSRLGARLAAIAQ